MTFDEWQGMYKNQPVINRKFWDAARADLLDEIHGLLKENDELHDALDRATELHDIDEETLNSEDLDTKESDFINDAVPYMNREIAFNFTNAKCEIPDPRWYMDETVSRYSDKLYKYIENEYKNHMVLMSRFFVSQEHFKILCQESGIEKTPVKQFIMSLPWGGVEIIPIHSTSCILDNEALPSIHGPIEYCGSVMPIPIEELKCTCGAEKCGFNSHSDWCDKAKKE